MSNKIFLIQDDETLHSLQAQEYIAEERLQRLLARYPSLLAGGQMNEEKPRRWILISREQGIPDRTESGDRWALDHVFLDQEGLPTLVEVKRSSNTRLRRSVVGQMLDYAANAVRHWPVDRIRADFEVRCQEEEIDPARAFAETFGEDHPAVEAPEAYWGQLREKMTRIGLSFPENPDEGGHPQEALGDILSEREVDDLTRTFRWVLEQVQSSERK